MVLPPINFPRWVEENQERLAPPVGNFCLFRSEDYTVMVVGGPNQRSDYHFQPTEEFFYQVKGGMILKIIEEGKFKDVPIEEGEMFMLPANTPHSPQRFENTVGLVVERTRPDGHDGESFPSAWPALTSRKTSCAGTVQTLRLTQSQRSFARPAFTVLTSGLSSSPTLSSGMRMPASEPALAADTTLVPETSSPPLRPSMANSPDYTDHFDWSRLKQSETALINAACII